MNEIKNPYIKINFYIRSSLRILSLTYILSFFVLQITIYYPHYKEISGMRKWAFFLWPLSQLSSIFINLPNYVDKFASYYLYHKEKPGITESAYNHFFLWSPPKLLLLGIFSDCIGKFSIYYLYYKEKLNISNLTRNFACNVELGLITKKRELPKTSLYLLLGKVQLLSLMISLTLLKMCLPIFEYLAMFKCVLMFVWQFSFKCTLISKWQFSPTLASFALLADRSLVKLTSKTSSNFSCLAQTTAQMVEILSDDNALLSKQL